MAVDTRDNASPAVPAGVMNFPNQVTTSRIVLAIVLFVFLGQQYYLTGLVLFVIAAGTDWLDGYWARKYGQVTVLGRILDPFADKMIICGSFIYLAAVPGSGVLPWMAVVVMGRELLVTALRSLLEERGADFSARMAGKLKMVLQCAAVAACLCYLAMLQRAASGAAPPPTWLGHAVTGLVWASVVSTVYSGVGYVFVAIRLFRG